MSDPFDDPEVQNWLKRMDADSGEGIRGSRFGISMWDGEGDALMAFQTGCMVLYDKPMIGLVVPGVHVPAKLAKVIDEWVEWADDPDELQRRLGDAIERIMEKFGLSDE